MFKKSAVAVALLSAGGVPYVMRAPEADRPASATSATTAGQGLSAYDPGAPHEPRTLDHAPTDPSQIEAQRLSDVLRFEITPAWVMGKWPRVSTGLSELELQGYRVPLLTGTGEADLAGSLTYYFNPKQELQRIAFQGSTGDPRQLVALVSAQHKLKYRQTDDPTVSVYQLRQWWKVRSELRIKAVPVVRRDEGRARYMVELKLERP